MIARSSFHRRGRTSLSRRQPFICAASIALFLVAGAGLARAADGTFTAVNGGAPNSLWSDTSAWLNGVTADGAGFTANFATLDITGPSAIHLDTARTIGNLTFGDTDATTPGTWTLDSNGNPANVLTLSGAAPSITANGGTGSTLTISTVLAGSEGITFAGNSSTLMLGNIGNTYTGDTILKGRVETTNLAPGNLSVFGATTNNVIFDGGYSRIFNTTTATSAGTLVNNLVVNTTGTLEYSGRSSTTGTLTGTGTLNVITHYVRSDNGGNWSGFAGTINVSSGDAGISDYRQTTYNGFANATLNLGANANLYFTPNQASNGTTAVDIGALSGVSSAFLRGGPIGGRITTFRIGAKNLDTTYAGSIVEQSTAISNIVKLGTGTLTLSGGASTYAGPTTINLGTLAVAILSNGGTASSIGSSSNAATNLVISGGAFRYVGAGSNTDRLFTIGATGGIIESSGTGTISFTNPGAITLAGVDTPRTLALGGANTDANAIAPTIGDNGVGPTSITKAGAGTWSLTGANTYTGPTVISGGVLGVSTLANGGAPSSIGQSTGAAANLVIDGGTLRYTGPATTTDRSFTVGASGATLDASGTGAISFTSTASPELTPLDAARTITLTGTSSGANALAAIIANSGTGATSLIKSGTGAWQLTGANTYTGGTTINAGVLNAANTTGSATGTGAVVVNNGGALGGTGFVSGVVTVNGGGRLSPGLGVGTLTVGNLTLAAGSVLDFEFNGTPSNDLITISTASGLTLNGGGFNLYVENTTNKWTTPGTYRLFQFGGTIGGAGVNSLSVLNQQAGLTYAFGTNAGFVTLTIGATATLSDWTSTTGGSWATPARWSNGIPNAQSDTANFLGGLTAPGTVTLDGNKTVGTIQFNNTNAYTIAQGTGGTLVLDNGSGNAAQITVINGSHAIAAPVNLVSNLTVDVNNAADTLTVSGVVGGPGVLNKAGSGTLSLSGTNTFAAGVRIAAGVVRIGSNLSLGTGNVTLTGSATLQAGTAGLAPANAIVIGDAMTLTVDTQANALVLSGTISDANANGAVQKTGTGTLTPSGTNTYRGRTAIAGGTMVASTLADGGVASSIGQSSNLAANLVIDGGTLRYTGTGASTDRLFTIGTNGATLESSGTGPLTLTNSGALVLSGTNAARTVTLGGSNTGINTLAAMLADNGSGATSLTKAGAGTWMLSGANTFSGQTIIAGGTLVLGNSLALQSSTLNYNNQGGQLSFDILGAATLGGLTGAQAIDLTNTLTGPVIMTVGGNNATTTYSGALTGSGALVKVGTGTLNLAGVSTFTGAATIAGGGGFLKAVITDALSPTTLITVNNPNGLQLGNGVTLNSTITAAVGANEFLDVPDAGAVATLGGALGVGGGANQFRLGISGADATLNLTGTTNLPNGASIVFLTRGNLIYSGTSTFTSAPGVTIGRAAQAISVTLKDNATFSLNNNSGFGGGQANPSIALTIQDNAAFNLSSFSLDLNASTAAANQTTVNLNGGSLTTGAFFKTSVGGTQLTNFNFNGGILRAGASSPTFLPAFGGLTADVKIGGAKIDTNGFDISVAQPLTHDPSLGVNIDGGLSKSGTGSLALDGFNTYTGPTSVAKGSLIVNGSIEGSATVVASVATLGGSGRVGNVSVSGTVAPGAPTGDLTATGSVNFAAGSTLALELSGLVPGTSYDQLTIDTTGALSINGATISLALTFAPAAGDPFMAIENTGQAAIAGEFSNLKDNGLLSASFGGVTYQFRADYQGGDGNDLTLVTVPEPHGAAILVVGSLGLLCRRRRCAG